MQRNILYALGLSVLLAGCGTSVGKLLDFGDKDTVLPGQRESVLQTNPSATDQAIASDPVVVPVAETNSSWMQPGGTASHAFHNLTIGPQPVRLFSVSAGEGSDRDGRLTASPIVAGGRVFVLDTEAVVRAFSADSGGLVWSRSLVPEGKKGRGAFGGGLATDGTHVYATSAFGEAIALDAGSGAIAWRKQVGSPIRAAPTVSNGRLLFTSVANQVFCLSASDGSEIWTAQGVGEQASIIASTSPAIDGETVVVPQTSGDVTAYQMASGASLWTDTLSSADTSSSLSNLNDIAARPVIDRGQVFAISHSGSFVSFDLGSGQRRWQRDLSGVHTPWVAGDYVFLVVGDNKMIAVSRKTGGVRWIKDLPAGIWAGPVMGNGKLIAVSSEGQLAMVSAQTGDVLNTIDLGSKFYIDPIIASGTIYLLSDNANLIALR
jgi:outer membrane protein assembly factor BamB